MNFSPFGGHFSTAIPAIHQFAAKFTHDTTGNTLCPQDNNRYTANGIPSFTQHHPPTQQQVLGNPKYQGNYANQVIYTQQSNVRNVDKRQGYEQQHELAQELCVAMLQHSQQEKQSSEKVGGMYRTTYTVNSNFTFPCVMEVPQGSHLGPLLFSLFINSTASTASIIQSLKASGKDIKTLQMLFLN